MQTAQLTAREEFNWYPDDEYDDYDESNEHRDSEGEYTEDEDEYSTLSRLFDEQRALNELREPIRYNNLLNVGFTLQLPSFDEEYSTLSRLFDEELAEAEARLELDRQRIWNLVTAYYIRQEEEDSNEYFGMSVMFDEERAVRRAAVEESLWNFSVIEPVKFPRIGHFSVVGSSDTVDSLWCVYQSELRSAKITLWLKECIQKLNERGTLVSNVFPLESHCESHICEVSDRRTFCRFVYPRGLFGPRVTTFLELKKQVEQFMWFITLIKDTRRLCLAYGILKLMTLARDSSRKTIREIGTKQPLK